MGPPSPAKENKGLLTVAIRKSPRTRQKEAFARRTAAIEAEFRMSARKKLNEKPKKNKIKKTKKVVCTRTTQNDEGTSSAAASLGTDKESNKMSNKKRKSNPQQSTSSKSSKGAAKVAKVAKVRKVVTRRTPAPPEEEGEEEQSSDDDNSSVAEVVKVRWVGTKHNPAPPVKEEEDSDDNHSPEPARYSDDDAFDDDGTSYHTAERSSSDDDDDILNNGNDDEAAVDDQDSSTSSNNYKMPSGGRDERAGHTASAIQTVATVSRAPTSAASSNLGLDGETLHIRGMSRSQSIKNRQKHVTDRVRIFVKSDIFRKIKFINSDASFQKAINLVMDHENVPEEQRGRFQMLYESVFNEALNTKRSSCEQSGGKIVRSTIAKLELPGEAVFTMNELTKLRRATTERELQAFYWFF